MDRLGIYIDNLSNVVVHKSTGDSAPVTRRWGHAFITWSTIHACLFTEQELRNMYR